MFLKLLYSFQQDIEKNVPTYTQYCIFGHILWGLSGLIDGRVLKHLMTNGDSDGACGGDSKGGSDSSSEGDSDCGSDAYNDGDSEGYNYDDGDNGGDNDADNDLEVMVEGGSDDCGDDSGSNDGDECGLLLMATVSPAAQTRSVVTTPSFLAETFGIIIHDRSFSP